MCLESVAILVLGHGDLRPHVLSIWGNSILTETEHVFCATGGVYQNYQHFLKNINIMKEII